MNVHPKVHRTRVRPPSTWPKPVSGCSRKVCCASSVAAARDFLRHFKDTGNTGEGGAVTCVLKDPIHRGLHRRRSHYSIHGLYWLALDCGHNLRRQSMFVSPQEPVENCLLVRHVDGRQRHFHVWGLTTCLDGLLSEVKICFPFMGWWITSNQSLRNERPGDKNGRNRG